MKQWSTRGLELQNGLSAVSVGFVLSLPTSTFGTSTTLIELEQYAPEWAWGMAFALFGAAQIWSVYRDVVIIRRVSAALLGILFAVYATTLFNVNPTSFGAAFMSPMALGQAWAFFQVRRVI